MDVPLQKVKGVPSEGVHKKMKEAVKDVLLQAKIVKLLCTPTSPRPMVHMCSVFSTLGLDLCTIHAVFGELRLAMNASPVVRPLW